MKHTLFLMVWVATLLEIPLAVSSAEPTGKPAAIMADAAVAVATVVAVDQDTRKVTLKGPDGDELIYTAGPEVRNFDQVKRGDRVIVSYYGGFGIGLGPKGSGIAARVDSVEVERAKPGEKPGATVTASAVAVGMVKAVDTEDRTVTLQGAKKTVTLEVAEDVDLSQVKVGDEVEALYVESYAVNVVPAPEVSGTVTLESTSVALGVGVNWGHGTLTMYDGTTHKFKVNGLSVIDLGISKVSAKGEVYNLVEAKDLNGIFVSGQAGIAVGGGGSAAAMKNRNGVVMQLKSTQVGIRLTLAPEGVRVTLVE